MILKLAFKEKISRDTMVIFLGLFYPAVNNYIWRVLTAITGLNGLVFTTEVMDAIVWVCFLVYLFATSRRIALTPKTFFIVLLFVFISLASFLLTEYVYFTSSVLIMMLLGACIFFLLGSFINLKKVSYLQLFVVAELVVTVSILYSLYTIIFKDASYEDNMDFAYKVLPAALVVFSGLFRKQTRKSAILFSILGAGLLLLQGTRGPLLCSAIFVCLMLYKMHGFGKLVIRVGAAALLVSILLSSPTVLNWLTDVTEEIDATGYSSRFFSMLARGELSDDNGRDIIQDRLLDDIWEDPIKVRGMFADRQATRGLKVEKWKLIYKDGTYAHNILIEIAYNWGMVLGGALAVFLFVIILKTMIKCSKEEASVIMVFVCVGFVSLFLSGTYLLHTSFFFLMGLTLNDSAHLRVNADRYWNQQFGMQYINRRKQTEGDT